MRFRSIIALLMLLAGSASAQSLTFRLHGYLTAREVYVDAPPSWSSGAFGRFDVGAQRGDARLVNVDIGQLGVDWTPRSWLALHADGIARREPHETSGNRAGLLQAFADVYNEKWRVRAGMFWLPTSRENVDPLWTSRYTITQSALNSWIGQEVRPIGVDLQYAPNFYATFGATVFRGNDTMGTLLSEHGWTFGNRLSTYDETIAVPDGVTRPIEHDLDGRNGYALRARVQIPEVAMLQVTRIDNRAALVPEIDGQGPWRTRFDIVGATVGLTSPTTVSAEWAHGSTAVAFVGGSFTLNFDTAYVLLSHVHERDRWSARIERFSTGDREHAPDDSSREHGHAVTLAWLREAGDHVRLGLEYAYAHGDRIGATAFGDDARTGGSTVTLEARYGF
jgi:hypothetical protein